MRCTSLFRERCIFFLSLFSILTNIFYLQHVFLTLISGKITSDGENVIGATVTATHQPSSTVYRAVTNIDGRYTIQGMVNYQGNGVYQFTGAYAYKSYSDYYSRWRGQVGLKYTF